MSVAKTNEDSHVRKLIKGVLNIARVPSMMIILFCGSYSVSGYSNIREFYESEINAFIGMSLIVISSIMILSKEMTEQTNIVIRSLEIILVPLIVCLGLTALIG